MYIQPRFGWGGWIRTLVNQQLNLNLLFQHTGRSTLYRYVGASKAKQWAAYIGLPHVLVTPIMKTTMTKDQLRQLLEQNNAVLFGQLAQYLDKRFDSLHDNLRADADCIYTTVDDIAKHL